MFLKILFALLVLIFSTQVTGCTTIDQCTTYIRSLYSATGTNRVPVGEVDVDTSPEPTGNTGDTLVVTADERGNAIISSGKGTFGMTPLALNDTDRKEAIEILHILEKRPASANHEGAERSPYVGAVSSDMGLLHGSAIIGVDYIHAAEGNAWMGKLTICYIDVKVISGKKPAGVGTCDKEIDMYLSPASTSTLLSLLKKVPQAATEARKAKPKE